MTPIMKLVCLLAVCALAVVAKPIDDPANAETKDSTESAAPDGAVAEAAADSSLAPAEAPAAAPGEAPAGTAAESTSAPGGESAAPGEAPAETAAESTSAPGGEPAAPEEAASIEDSNINDDEEPVGSSPSSDLPTTPKPGESSDSGSSFSELVLPNKMLMCWVVLTAFIVKISEYY